MHFGFFLKVYHYMACTTPSKYFAHRFPHLCLWCLTETSEWTRDLCLLFYQNVANLQLRLSSCVTSENIYVGIYNLSFLFSFMNILLISTHFFFWRVIFISSRVESENKKASPQKAPHHTSLDGVQRLMRISC